MAEPHPDQESNQAAKVFTTPISDTLIHRADPSSPPPHDFLFERPDSP